MIAVHKDTDDKVIGYIDYDIVRMDGTQDKDGIYCFVRDAWIHKSARHKFKLKDFVMKEHKKFPKVLWIYFEHRKYSKRTSIYDITRFYRRR